MYSEQMVQEILLCYADPAHFIKRHLYMDPEFVQILHFSKADKNTQSLVHASTVTSEQLAAYTLWYAIFKENENIAVISPRHAHVDLIRTEFETLAQRIPSWMGSKMVENNKRSKQFENHTRVMFMNDSPYTLRGHSLNLIVLHNFDNFNKDPDKSMECDLAVSTAYGATLIVNGNLLSRC